MAQVKRCPPVVLEVLFNILIYRRYLPDIWRASRTSLIPKDSDRRDPANWWTITIGSAVQRLMHRILAKRLVTALDIHPLQRGFMNVDDTLANTLILDQYIRSRCLRGKSYTAISLAVRKSFDTVAHSAIVRALRCTMDPTPPYLWITSPPGE